MAIPSIHRRMTITQTGMTAVERVDAVNGLPLRRAGGMIMIMVTVVRLPTEEAELRPARTEDAIMMRMRTGGLAMEG